MMKHLFLLPVLVLTGSIVVAQVTGLPVGREQELENITANNDDHEPDDDGYLQQMIQFIKHPVNLNTADENELAALMILTPVQVRNLISYRLLLGKLIDLYELQALPGWDIHTIRKIRPYVTVSTDADMVSALGKRFKHGDNSVLLRVTQTLERSRGFFRDRDSANNFYPGSPQKLLFRYTYVYKNLLQYGVLGEKDAGEQFFKGSQRNGFDFYSAHFFARNIGMIRSLALGDFTVNFGQGLTQWQTLAFKKSPDILDIKRQGAILQPYHSSGEINFHRGIGITIGKNKWEATLFGSYRKVDGNFVSDTAQVNEPFISSLETSGYHRTKAEVEDKNIQRQVCFGGNISYRYKQLHIGINAIHYHFALPIIKDPEPYNKYALPVKDAGNYSVDYSYTFRNMHFFGEGATGSNHARAFVSGLLISMAANVDMSFLYRNISPEYQSFYTNAFTENTYPVNEKGFFAGIAIRPADAWQITAYADMYRFPWLKYRVNAPSTGADYLVQLTYEPNKQLELYSWYKRGSKGINDNPGDITLSPVSYQPMQDWRIQFRYKIDRQFAIRNSTEMVWFDKRGTDASAGFSMYAELFYKPLQKPLSANIRLQYFETTDYNSRLYAYESDVLYSFSIPVFYDKGYRYYVNIDYDINQKLTLWARWAQTIYPGKAMIGSGLDEIRGDKKSEVKLQLAYKF